MMREVCDRFLAAAVLGGTVTRKGLAVLAAAVLLFASSASAAEPGAEPAGEQSAEDDGFRVESRRVEDHYGTRQDVDTNITDDLAAKLRQFDEWTVDGEGQTAAEAAQQAALAAQQAAAAAAASGGASGAHGGAGSGMAAAGDPGSGSHRPSAGPFDPNASGNPTGGLVTQSTGPGTPQQMPPARADRRAKEDDVARMIREAAEQETDPQRRRELMDQYDAYVDSL